MSTISASTLITTALQYTADTTGTLVFKTGATPTTALTLNDDQSATFAGTVNFATAGFTNLSYTGTLTGGTGVVNIGSGQIYKTSGGDVGIGTATPLGKLTAAGDIVSQTSLNISDTFYIQSRKSRGTITALATVNNGDKIGGYLGLAYDGTNWLGTAAIEYRVNGVVTTNSIPTDIIFYASNTNVPSGGAERMRIDSSGNVGIGTSSPNTLLNISKSVAGDVGPELRLNNDAANAGDAGRISLAYSTSLRAALDMKISAGGTGEFLFSSGVGTLTEKMRLDASGNLGIGTSSPANKLTVKAATNVNLNVLTGNTASNLRLIALNDAANATIGMELQASSHAFLINSTDGMRIDSSGNLLVGRSDSDGYRISVLGNTQLTSSVQLTYVGVAASSVGVNSGGAMAFGLDGASGTTERMRIDSSGNLLVGTTTTRGAGTSQVAIIGSSTNRGFFMCGTTTQATSTVVGSIQAYNGTQAIASLDFSSTAANNSGQISTYTWNLGAAIPGPYVATGGTSWTSSSDETLKDIIEPITNGLEKVASLRSVIGKFKTDHKGTRRVFLIAQDVQAVLPEAVNTDNNGNLGLNYQDTIPLLVAAIKELKAEFDEYKATHP